MTEANRLWSKVIETIDQITAIADKPGEMSDTDAERAKLLIDMLHAISAVAVRVTPPERPDYTIPELVETLNSSRTVVEGLLASGEFEGAYILNRSKRIPAPSVELYKARNAVGVSKPPRELPGRQRRSSGYKYTPGDKVV